MGYTTDFYGTFSISGNITYKLVKYIDAFSAMRHCAIDPDFFKSHFPDWKEYGFNGNIGKHGEYIAIPSENIYDLQAKYPDYVETNRYNIGIPFGYWCHWNFLDNSENPLFDDGIELVDVDELIGKKQLRFGWDGSEKFYDYEDWLRFMIFHFFIPSGVFLNGATLAVGEGDGDAKYIIIKNNEVLAVDALSKGADVALRKYCSNDVFKEVYQTPEEISHHWDY